MQSNVYTTTTKLQYDHVYIPKINYIVIRIKELNPHSQKRKRQKSNYICERFQHERNKYLLL